jgi:hypothetical protein
LPSVKDLISPSGEPGVAFLKPLGFRYSPAKVGKWYNPAKVGYADVPGIKTEIETIFRPGAGSYAFESGKYYTKISGVRVPIDVFKYSSDISGTTSTGKTFVSSSYSSYSSPALIDLTSGISSAANVISYPSSRVASSSIQSSLKSSLVPSYSQTSVSSTTSSISKSISRSYGSPNLRSSVSSMLSSISGSSSIKGSSTGYSYRQITPPPFIPKFSFGYMGGLKSRNVFGKQPKKYTPSFEAIIFNIKGKAPKGMETGARFRPITKGFSWFNTRGNSPSFKLNYKLPKFNFNVRRKKRR